MKPGRVLAFGGFSAMFSICSFFAADWQRVLDEFLHLLEQSLVGLCVSLFLSAVAPFEPTYAERASAISAVVVGFADGILNLHFPKN